MAWADFGVALGLVLVIEGVLLALIPDRLTQMTVLLLQQPAQRLRLAGLAAAAIGLFVVWLIRG